MNDQHVAEDEREARSVVSDRALRRTSRKCSPLDPYRTATSVSDDSDAISVIRPPRRMMHYAQIVPVVACVPTIDGVQLRKTPHHIKSLVIAAGNCLRRTRYHTDGVNVASR